MVSVTGQVPRELPKLSSPQIIEAKSYTPVRNRLAEQDNRPMNQTYTIGTKQNPLQQSLKGRERSCSIDSDIAEYTISGAISGLFPRAYNRSNSNIPTTTSTNRTPTRSPSSSTLTRVFSTKLPSLDGCSPERKCCQRPNFGRAQFDLQKFKETIKNAH